MFRNLLLASLLVLCALNARATTMGLHLVSVHVPTYTHQQNTNPGIYLRTDEGWTMGIYRNTIGRTSMYAGYTLQGKWADLTVGLVTGYQRETITFRGHCDDGSVGVCVQQIGWSKGRIAPMIAPSVRLPVISGLAPRIAYVPNIGAGRKVSAFHLMLEREF